MAIEENDAFEVFQSIDTLPEDMRPRAALMLSDYRKQQESAKQPLWPAQEKAKQERRQRMQAAFDNPLELDKDNGAFLQADRIQAGLGDTLRKREASILWLADRYGADEADVRERLDFYKADASEKWGSGLLDDSAFFAKANGEVEKGKQIELIQQDAFTSAMQAAWSGKPMLTALNEWQGVEMGPQDKTKMEQTPVFMRAYREAAEKQRPYRGVIADVVKMAKSMDDNPEGFQFSEMADRLLTVPPQDRALVLEAIANSAPKPEEGRAVLQRLAMSMDRGLDRLVDTGITGFVGKAMSDLEQSAQTSPLITEEQRARLASETSRTQDYLDLRDDMREIATGQLSPLKDVRFMGANLSGVAENLPMTISSFAPYIGPALLVGSMQRDTANSLRRDYPGMSRADRESIAAWSSPFQAATEVVSDRLLLGRLPNLRRVFSSPALSARGIAAQFAQRVGVGAATETAEEFVQGITPMLVMEAQQALQKDVPDANWGRFFDGFGNNLGELAAVILPMALIGAGAGQFSDFSNARDLAQDERALIAAKYSPEGAAKIAEAAKAGDWQKAQDLMRADWKTVNAKAEPLSEVASRAFTKASTEIAAEVQQSKSEAAQALEQSATKGIFPRIRADVNGWAVEDLDTGSMVRVGNRAEAIELAYSGMSDKERQSAEAMAQMADEFLGDRSRPEAFEITKNEQRLEDEVKAGRVTQEQVREAAQLYGQMHGLTAEESKIELLEVFGNNIPEENERVREYVSRIHGGGNLITVIHEGVHGRWNAGLKNGHYTHEQGLMWVRMAEQASGVQFLPVSDDAQVSPAMLDEAMAEMVSADVVGRRKDVKQHFSPGLISRGISAFALGEREVVLGEGKRVASGKSWVTSDGRVIEGKKWAGKFAVFLKSWKGFWGKVLRNAKALQKARKEGKIGEDFDAFFDDLLGAEPQVRYEAQAAREATDMANGIDNAPFSLRAVPTSEIQTIPEDLERAKADAEKAGPGWAASVDLSEPVGVYRDKEGNLKLFDGHHRWLAADMRGEPLQVRESVFEAAPFSLGPRSLAAVADTVLASKMRSPQFREGFYTEARRRLAKLRTDGEWKVNKLGVASRRVGFDSRMAGVRDPANIEAERKFRFRSRQRELIDEGMLAADAEAQARKESDQWAKDETAKIPTQKERQMMALRTLDAILSAFPPEVRGRVGGFVKLASLNTDKAREAEIERRLNKLDEVVESEARKYYTAKIEKLFKRFAPKRESGKKPVGKLDPDAQELVDAARAAMGYDDARTRAELAAIDSMLAEDGITYEREIQLERQRELVQLFGDLDNAESARTESAAIALEDTATEGWAKWKIQKLMERERRTAARESLIADTGKPSLGKERDKQNKWAKTTFGKAFSALLNVSSFSELLRFEFGEKSQIARQLEDQERAAAYAYEDAMQAFGDRVGDFFAELGGSRLAGEQLRFDLAQPTLTVGTGDNERSLSQLQGIQALLMWQQEDGRRHMEGEFDENAKPSGKWHYGEEWIKDLESKLSPQAYEVKAFLEQLYSEEYGPLNAIYRQRHGVNLPKNERYSPITVQPMQAKAGEMVDPVSGFAVTGSMMTPGGLRSRNKRAVAEPRFDDAVQIFLGHSRQMEHWKAYYDFAMEAQAILLNREVTNAVESKGSTQAVTVLKKWVDQFAQGGSRDAQTGLEISSVYSRLSGRAARVALLGRISTLLIQSTQLAAASVKMPVGSYIKRLGLLLSGNLDYTGAVQSPFMQRRYKTAPPIVQQALAGVGNAERPGVFSSTTPRILGNALSGADALFTGGTYAMILDYHRTVTGPAMGLQGAELETFARNEAERDTEAVAQPVRAGTRSIFENTLTSPLAKTGFAFASEARQKAALFAWSAYNAKSDPVQTAKVAFLTFIVGGLVSQVLKNLWREAKDDDDEKMWSAERLAKATLAGPLHGVPGVSELMGDPGLFSGFAWSMGGVKKIATKAMDDDLDEVTMRDIENALSAAGYFNDTAAGIAGLSHLGFDFAKILQALGDGED